MHIYTFITKKSVREILKERRFLKAYSLVDFAVGDMFETIDGNRKSHAIILKKESARDLKEMLRSGTIQIQKLKLSKTGPLKNGLVVSNFSIENIKTYLKDPAEAHKTSHSLLTGFFPKKRSSAAQKKVLPKSSTEKRDPKKENKAQSMADILASKNFLKKHKVYHSEMQEMVDTIRKHFNEKNVYGMGSFPYYIGMFKQVPKREIYQFFGEAKNSRKNKETQKRIFWFRMGKYIREKNFKKENEKKNLKTQEKNKKEE